MDKRVFIAIEFQEDIKDYLNKIQDIVVEKSIKGNFTLIENFHLTLKFIGMVDDIYIEKIKTSIDEVALNQNNFNLYLNNLGRFPKGSKSIVWTGVKDSNDLNNLYLDLETSLEKIGISKEGRGFNPHITLGRQVRFEGEFNEIINEIEIENMKILVERISLMESKRINDVLRYVPIYTKSFK